MIRWPFACAVLMLTSGAVFAAPDTGDLFYLCPPNEGMRLVVESLDEDAIRGSSQRNRYGMPPKVAFAQPGSTTPKRIPTFTSTSTPDSRKGDISRSSQSA